MNLNGVPHVQSLHTYIIVNLWVTLLNPNLCSPNALENLVLKKTNTIGPENSRPEIYCPDIPEPRIFLAQFTKPEFFVLFVKGKAIQPKFILIVVLINAN